MNPERMGTRPEGVDRAKQVIEVLREAGIEPDGVEFRRRGPEPHSGLDFAVHFDEDNDAFEDEGLVDPVRDPDGRVVDEAGADE